MAKLFSLVVITGLVAGLFMIAQHMVFLSGVRAQAGQIEHYNMAVTDFQTKYGCLPGDCTDAPQKGLGDLSGDGDGIIIGFRSPNFPLAGTEKTIFWQHLSKSGLIDETFTAAPNLSAPVPGAEAISPRVLMRAKTIAVPAENSGGFWVADGEAVRPVGIISHHAWALIKAIAPLNGPVGIGLFAPYETGVLDSKIDDGWPLSGKMVAVTRLGTIADGGITDGELKRDTTTSVGALACIKDSVNPAIYNVKVKSRGPISLCAPIIAAPF